MTMTEEGLLVYSEDRELELQILGKGRELADRLDTELYALLVGTGIAEADTLIEHGVDKVYVADDPKLAHFAVEPYRAVVLEAVKRAYPEILLIGATKRGKELAPRVAAALDTGCMTECIKLDVDDQRRLVGERLTYGGSSIATEVSHRKPHMATIPPRAFQKPQPSKRTGEVVKLAVDLTQPRAVIVERREKTKGDLGLEEAPIIVSAGRGFRQKEDLRLLEELAEVLGAKIGCTRPIAADNGWLEEWIGLSGLKVRPRLYIACGISGTIQHAAGIRDAQIIVSVNNNEAANIFELSDYGVVGDLYKVLPALIKAIKEKAK